MKYDEKPIQGRWILQEGSSVVLRSEARDYVIQPSHFLGSPQIGDIVRFWNGNLEKVTSNQSIRKSGSLQKSTQWMQRVLNPRRVRAIHVRNQVEREIRNFFLDRGFYETRTPLLVPCPGMETHIRPFSVRRSSDLEKTSFLPTSPEFAMKRLLVGGLERIFQMAPAFRDEPFSPSHFPEFTMLEWYRAYAGYEAIMEDTENLFASIATTLFGRPVIQYQEQEISLETPWPRLKVRDLFIEKVGIDLVQNNQLDSLKNECLKLNLPVNEGDTWDDLYFKIWLNFIEPTLPKDRAVFVTRYPASQAALAVIDKDADGSPWAKRFEVYAGGLELGNAFEELTDAEEQRKRFIDDMELRHQIYGSSFPKNPLDEGFLQALEEGMPPSGGIAIGVDRMVMLFADEPEIDYTFWLRPN